MTEDGELIKQVLGGNVNVFEQLIEKYKRHVFRIVAKYIPVEVVDEVSQSVFIKAFESLKTFRNEAPFEHWLAKLSVRTCYDFWRKERRQKEVTITAEHLALLDANVSFEAFDIAENDRRLKDLLDWAMSNLSSDEKVVTTLLYLEGYSEKESAEILGWSLSNVKGRAFRARRHLEVALEKAVAEGEL